MVPLDVYEKLTCCIFGAMLHNDAHVQRSFHTGVQVEHPTKDDITLRIDSYNAIS